MALTTGVRMLSRLLGPRRGTLLLGLPCSSALALVLDCSGHERGVGFAAGMADSSLLGLVSAAALPIAHAQAFGLGCRWRRSEVIWRSLGASA